MAIKAPNYTQTPNDFFDELLPQIKSIAELKVTLVVIRNTIGWRKDKVKLSLSEIIRKTGLSKHSVIDGITLAMERGTIAREKAGESYSYSLNIEEEIKPPEVVQNLHPPSAEFAPEVVQNLHQRPYKENIKEIARAETAFDTIQDEADPIPALSTEAIQIYTDEIKSLHGQASLHAQTCISAEHIQDMEVWRETCHAWHINNYSPRNLSGLFEKYRTNLEKKTSPKPTVKSFQQQKDEIYQKRYPSGWTWEQEEQRRAEYMKNLKFIMPPGETQNA